MKDLGAFVVFLLFIYDTWILHSTTTKQINCDFFVVVIFCYKGFGVFDNGDLTLPSIRNDIIQPNHEVVKNSVACGTVAGKVIIVILLDCAPTIHKGKKRRQSGGQKINKKEFKK